MATYWCGVSIKCKKKTFVGTPDMTIIVAMFTIVAIYQSSQHRSQLLQQSTIVIWSATIVATVTNFSEKSLDLLDVYTWLKDDVTLNVINLDYFSQYCRYFALSTCHKYTCSHIVGVLRANLAIFVQGLLLCHIFCYLEAIWRHTWEPPPSLCFLS